MLGSHQQPQKLPASVLQLHRIRKITTLKLFLSPFFITQGFSAPHPCFPPIPSAHTFSPSHNRVVPTPHSQANRHSGSGRWAREIGALQRQQYQLQWKGAPISTVVSHGSANSEVPHPWPVPEVHPEAGNVNHHPMSRCMWLLVQIPSSSRTKTTGETCTP